MERKTLLAEGTETRDCGRRCKQNQRITETERIWVEDVLKELFPHFVFSSIEKYAIFHDNCIRILKRHSFLNIRMYIYSLGNFTNIQISKKFSVDRHNVGKIVKKIKIEIKKINQKL